MLQIYVYLSRGWNVKIAFNNLIIPFLQTHLVGCRLVEDVVCLESASKTLTW